VPRVACTLLLLAALGIGLAPGSPRAAPTALLGTLEWPADAADKVPQWLRVRAAMAREAVAVDACARAPDRCPDPATAGWVAFLRGLAGATPLEQVEAVQRYVNRWPYRTDLETHGRSDYWATPLEFFRRSGDCEDYAIAKYASLRRLGFAPERLRLVVLEDTARRLAHAVLAVYLGGEVYLLDNLAEAPLPQRERPQYVPYYSLSEQAQWRHALPSPELAAAEGMPRPPASPPPPGLGRRAGAH
jgi:predicted transglutaminase-like cysteine proteinase